ncbi:hypothetical protein SESBI_16500, partial [Sesbania bispinosa]
MAMGSTLGIMFWIFLNKIHELIASPRRNNSHVIERRESRFVATSVSDHERDGEGAPFVAIIVRAEREPYRVRVLEMGK